MYSYAHDTIFLHHLNPENSLNGNYSEVHIMSNLTNVLRKLAIDFVLNCVLRKLGDKRKKMRMLEVAILENAKDRCSNKAKEYAQYFWVAAKELGIELTHDIVVHLVSQLGHETGGFMFHEERSPKNVDAHEYFEGMYGMRKALGNTEPGDGYKYRGRGFVQLTGKANYERYGKKLGIDLVNDPDQASDIGVAARVAMLYFKENVFRTLTHQDFEQDVVNVSKAINCPSAKAKEQINGLKDRIKRALKTKDILQC